MFGGRKSFSRFSAFTIASKMQPAPYKVCPACGQSNAIAATRCPKCGHAFSTQFKPPDQTQAFFPGDQGAAYQQQPYSQYPRQSSSSDSFSNFMLGLPAVVCFIVAFFFQLLGVVMIVLYFGNGPTRDSQRGWASVWGVVASFGFGICIFGLFAVLPMLSGHR